MAGCEQVCEVACGPSVNATTIWLATRAIDRLTKLNCKNVVLQWFPELTDRNLTGALRQIHEGQDKRVAARNVELSYANAELRTEIAESVRTAGVAMAARGCGPRRCGRNVRPKVRLVTGALPVDHPAVKQVGWLDGGAAQKAKE